MKKKKIVSVCVATMGLGIKGFSVSTHSHIYIGLFRSHPTRTRVLCRVPNQKVTHATLDSPKK